VGERPRATCDTVLNGGRHPLPRKRIQWVPWTRSAQNEPTKLNPNTTPKCTILALQSLQCWEIPAMELMTLQESPIYWPSPGHQQNLAQTQTCHVCHNVYVLTMYDTNELTNKQNIK
jgi:hypothetical protein